jgi:hypothetical protein
MFAGSILDLEPDTGYEARFTMSDPDGFIGQTAKIVTKTVSVRTRLSQSLIPAVVSSTSIRPITRARGSSRLSTG